MELWYENTCLSWVRKTLTLQYMCILVGLSQFCGWFRVSFVLVERFMVKMAKTGPFLGLCATPLRLGVELCLGGGPYA